ncbi:hypothetical protein B9Z55_023338 [Caenorhabditis nigoni]|uniref:Uncharacterized protein n=1 Tax=Caenorhabditis nigoni TaxID=1611254 RepID=A0A2G5SPR2_9PELO|nr:hypothetical protein B9Z55_023338 [Caenorhabditis nigoni]
MHKHGNETHNKTKQAHFFSHGSEKVKSIKGNRLLRFSYFHQVLPSSSEVKLHYACHRPAKAGTSEDFGVRCRIHPVRRAQRPWGHRRFNVASGEPQFLIQSE